MANLIHCTLEVDDEFICMDMHLSTGGQMKDPSGEEPKGMTKAMQLMHLVSAAGAPNGLSGSFLMIDTQIQTLYVSDGADFE